MSAFDLTMNKYSITAANNAAQPAQLKDCAEFTAKHKIFSPNKFFKLEQINEMVEIMQNGAMAGSRMVVKFDESASFARL